MQTFGFVSGMLSTLRNFKMYQKIARAIFKIQPEIFIAVAYPGINLILCRYAKKLGIRVIYLLPPQIWAWGTFRKYFIKKWTDLIISIFPFECNFYKNRNINVIYWQNPLFEELERYKRRDFSQCIGFMPGSRIPEIKRNTSVIIELIKNCKELQNFKFIFILHPDVVSGKILDRLIAKELQNKVKIVIFDRYQEMCNCDFIITCSGTASLETMIMGIPQIFFNRPNFFDYHFFRHLLKIREYNLPNLYYGKTIVPSFVLRNKKKLVDLILSEFCRLSLKDG